MITAEQFTRYETLFIVLGSLSQVVYTITYAAITLLGTKTFAITIGLLINPRRACAARVTVLRLSVCLSVRLSVCYN